MLPSAAKQQHTIESLGLKHKVGLVPSVEHAGNVPRELQVLRLVIADRHMRGPGESGVEKGQIWARGGASSKFRAVERSGISPKSSASGGIFVLGPTPMASARVEEAESAGFTNENGCIAEAGTKGFKRFTPVYQHIGGHEHRVGEKT